MNGSPGACRTEVPFALEGRNASVSRVTLHNCTMHFVCMHAQPSGIAGISSGAAVAAETHHEENSTSEVEPHQHPDAPQRRARQRSGWEANNGLFKCGRYLFSSQQQHGLLSPRQIVL